MEVCGKHVVSTTLVLIAVLTMLVLTAMLTMLVLTAVENDVSGVDQLSEL